jgi:mono/diheme cytochrome c family protein
MIMALTNCAGSERSEPLKGPLELHGVEQQRGQRLYFQFCYQCHQNGEGGLAPALNDKPAPAVAIRLQVRKGLGDMPSFSEDLISDRDLDAIVEYIKALRSHGT